MPVSPSSLYHLRPAIGNIKTNRLEVALGSIASLTDEVLLALFGSPVAVSSAIMAREMKSDATLAGQYVVYTSVVSVFTIFGFILILRAAALI